MPRTAAPPRPRSVLTRERILAEAARVFNRRGFHGATLADVARALGVTKAALYYHVRSKEELLYECCRVPIEIALGGLRRARDEVDAPDEQLRQALAAYITAMTDQLRGSVVLREDGALSPEHQRAVRAGRDAYEAELVAIIEKGMAEDVFAAGDARLVTFALLGAMNWIPRWFHPDGRCSGEEVAAAFSTYLVRGLLGPGRPAPAGAAT